MRFRRIARPEGQDVGYWLWSKTNDDQTLETNAHVLGITPICLAREYAQKFIVSAEREKGNSRKKGQIVLLCVLRSQILPISARSRRKIGKKHAELAKLPSFGTARALLYASGLRCMRRRPLSRDNAEKWFS
jgi:hypothetical protein